MDSGGHMRIRIAYKETPLPIMDAEILSAASLGDGGMPSTGSCKLQADGCRLNKANAIIAGLWDGEAR
jgi:hypothetical protein